MKINWADLTFISPPPDIYTRVRNNKWKLKIDFLIQQELYTVLSITSKILLIQRNCFNQLFFFSQLYAECSCILKFLIYPKLFSVWCSMYSSLFPFSIVFWVQLYHVISRTSLMLAVFDINLVHRLPATCLPLPHGQRRGKKKRHSPVFYLVYCLIAPSTAKDASALGWVNFHRMNLIGLGNPTFFLLIHDTI